VIILLQYFIFRNMSLPALKELANKITPIKSYEAFTLNGFDDQERNLTFVNTDFQVLKLKFYAYNFKQAFYSLHKLYVAGP